MDIENISKKNLCLLEATKWFSIVGLLLVSIIGNYLCRNYSVVLRSISIVLIMVVVIYIVSTTKFGKLLFVFGKESRIELRQVVWPTYQDGLNTTLVVIAVTVVMSLVLWGLDAIAVYIISFGLKL